MIMIVFLKKYKYQVLILALTVAILLYFPFFIGQFAIASYVGYIILSSLLVRFARARSSGGLVLFMCHGIAFIFAYAVFLYTIANISSITHFGY